MGGGDPGADPKREDATVHPPTHSMRFTAQPIHIRLRQHGWSVWAQIAIDHERDARRARETGETTEHLPGLVAIAAAAFALDALYGVAKGLIPVPEVDDLDEAEGDDSDADEPDAAREGKRGRHIGDRLRRGVSPGSLGDSWPKRIRELYATRSEAVHFGEKDSDPVWHEGLQSNMSPEAVSWRLERAEVAVDLMLEVFTAWTEHPSKHVRGWADSFGPTVASLAERRQGEPPSS